MADTTFVPGTSLDAAWCNDTNTLVYRVKQTDSGSINRQGVDKIREIPSLDDFNGTMASFEAAAKGGLAVLPRATYSFGTYELTADGVYTNGSTNWLSSFLHNIGETPGVTTTKHLTLTSTTGTNVGKKRFGYILRMSSQGAGSSVLVDGTGDFAKGTITTKQNYNASPVNGEIGGNYTVVRQGGASASLNDCSAELYNVATYSDSFACLTEGVTSKLNSSSVITDAIRVQTGYINKGTGVMGGVDTSVDTGTASNIYSSTVQSGASTTAIQTHIDMNRPAGRRTIYSMTSIGAQYTLAGSDLASTLASSVTTKATSVYNSNKDSIAESIYRTAAGSNYTTAEWRLQRIVDSTFGGGISFGYDATRGFKVSLTANNNNLFTVGSNNSVGFNGATPITKPALPAAATDLATAITLVNAIRSALISYGLAT